MNKALKILILSLISSSLIFFSGCKRTEELGQKFIDNSKKTYDNAATKVKEVKDAAVEKANQIQDAAKKVKEAVDAVDKVTK